MEMLEQIEVREIICGISSSLEILDIHEWITSMYKLDQETFATRIISMDVENVRTTFYDTLRLKNWRSLPGTLFFKPRLSQRSFTGLGKMLGDRSLVRL